MSSTKEYSKSYVFGLNQQIRMLKQGIACHRRLNRLQEEEIRRLRKDYHKLNSENLGLAFQVIKLKEKKKWWQFWKWFKT